ncbi:hypothetical protein [Enterococcus ureasiticus]|nr:hypothetical protein [Enterococcus ureasiticus]
MKKRMTTEQTEKHQNKGLKYILVIEGIFSIMWVTYLVMFYSFYKKAYFYVDKRLSLFYQLLLIVNDNGLESIVYFALSALLMTMTFVFMYFLFLTNKRRPYPKAMLVGFIGLNLLCFLLLFINVYGVAFFIIAALSGSIVYALAMIGKKEDFEEELEYEEGDVIETKGPFETKASAHQAAQLFLETWQEKETVILEEDLYQEEDNHYYVDIYVEAIKK